MATISVATATRGKNGTNDTKRESDTNVGAAIVDLGAARELKLAVDPLRWIDGLTEFEPIGEATSSSSGYAKPNQNFTMVLADPLKLRTSRGGIIEVPEGAELTVYRKLLKLPSGDWRPQRRRVLAAIMIRRGPGRRDTQITIRTDGAVLPRDLQ